jgi:hypothetical protein
MDENCKVPTPINFNCWKHHAGFIRKQISLCRKQADLETLKTSLLKVGGSQMDLYLGNYSPLKISKSVIKFLHASELSYEGKYNEWLKTGGTDYKIFKLNDNSIWTLRFGATSERYVHIHPGRNSPNTIRVRALTLKTAVSVLCWARINKCKQIDLEIINSARKNLLKQPPLKSFSKDSGLGKILGALA